MMYADLALINGNIITMDSKKLRAQAIAIKNQRIIKVGTNNQISQLINDSTKIIQLEGRTVIPGLIDTHIHVAAFGRHLDWLDLTDCKSIKDMQTILKNKISQTIPNKWILGRGWNEKNFKKNQFPNRYDLDTIAPNNPVVLYNQSGNLCLVNTEALCLMNINSQKVKLLKENTIKRDLITGDPTGILEGKALDLIWDSIPEPDQKDLLELTHCACLKILKAGITSIHWMVLSYLEFSIIKKLKEKGIPLRIYAIIPFEIWKKEIKQTPSHGLKNNTFKIGGIEIAIDGYLANKTAALFKPYNDGSYSTGNLFQSSQSLYASVSDIIQSGFQPVLHAMGDKAVELALVAIEKLMKKTEHQNTRIRLEQAALINKNLIDRTKNKKIIISVQPCVINSEFKTWNAIDNLGSNRARWLFPLRTLINKKILLIGGSDCPMEPLNPFQGIQKIVDRKFFPEESITLTEAIAMYTINAAYSTNEEKYKGSIEEGKIADLTILSIDPTVIPSNNIKNVEVETTIVGGEIIYNKRV